MRYINVLSEYQKKTYAVKDGYKLEVRKNQMLAKGAAYASKGKSKLKVKEEGKVLETHKDRIVIGIQEMFTKPLFGLIPHKNKNGEEVFKGEILTTGALDIREYKDIVGDIQTQRYIIREVKKVYMAQGQDLNDKHIEVVIKQLFSKVFVEDS